MDEIKALKRYNEFVDDNNIIVSVFMLTHNREHYLELAINSVLNQTYKNFVLFVLDNMSEDNTRHMVENIEDSRLIYLLRESYVGNLNVEFAKNNCCTKYFIVLHDDDILEPNYLSEILKIMEKNNFDALSVAAKIIDSEGKCSVNPTFSKEITNYIGAEYFTQFFSDHFVTMIYPSVIYRSEFYDSSFNFDDCFKAGPAGDVLVWLETERRGGKLAYYDQGLINYRVHPNQDSSINAGFINLQLIDYLLNIDYYKELIELNISGLIKVLWVSYRTIAMNYYKGNMTLERYKSCFDYDCVRYSKKFFKGKLLNLIAVVSCRHQKLVRFILKFIHKL